MMDELWHEKEKWRGSCGANSDTKRNVDRHLHEFETKKGKKGSMRQIFCDKLRSFF